MTGSLDIVINAPYSGQYVDYVPAVSRGLQSFQFPHTDGASSIINYAGSGDGSITGSPVYDSNSAKFVAQATYLQTALAGSADQTFMAVCATDDTLAANANNPDIMGNWSNNVSGAYIGLNLNGGLPSIIARRVVLISGTPTSGSAYQLAFAPSLASAASQYRFIAVTFTSGVGMKLYNKTGSTLGTPLDSGSIQAETRTPVVGPNVRVGSSYSTHSGNCRVAFAAHHNVALTDAEITAAYNQIKAYFAEASTPLSI